MGKGYLAAGLAAVAISLTLSGACEAKGVTGRYTYVEPGYEGTMTISQMGTGLCFQVQDQEQEQTARCATSKPTRRPWTRAAAA